MAPDRWSAPKMGRGEGADIRDVPNGDDEAEIREAPRGAGPDIR
jgi:hypothetical protein